MKICFSTRGLMLRRELVLFRCGFAYNPLCLLLCSLHDEGSARCRPGTAGWFANLIGSHPDCNGDARASMRMKLPGGEPDVD